MMSYCQQWDKIYLRQNAVAIIDIMIRIIWQLQYMQKM
jgi:hypothetical protein